MYRLKHDAFGQAKGTEKTWGEWCGYAQLKTAIESFCKLNTVTFEPCDKPQKKSKKAKHPKTVFYKTKEINTLKGNRLKVKVEYLLPKGCHSANHFENKMLTKIDRLLRKEYKKNPQR